MKENEILESLDNAVSSLMPDLCETILKTPAERMTQPDDIISQKKTSVWRGKKVRAFAAMAAGLLVCFLAGHFFMPDEPTYCIVSLDVNPGIELSIDKDNRVKKVAAANREAIELCEDMELEGMDLAKAVENIEDILYDQGYLNKEEGAFVLLSVNSDSKERQTLLADLLQESLSNRMEKFGVGGMIISQQFGADKKALKYTQEYGITLGKAHLINRIMTKTNEYQAEDLAGFGIEQLLDICIELKFNDEISFIHVLAKQKSQSKNYTSDPKVPVMPSNAGEMNSPWVRKNN